jgi:TPR repeat protein
MQGEGVAQDLSESIRWLRRAEAQGDADAHEAIKAVMERARSQKKKAAAQPPPPVAVGARVELRGIKARPSDDVLNGQQGSVTAFNASTGRCSVQLDDGRGPINVKPENVKPLL